jgi:hypothetical protein
VVLCKAKLNHAPFAAASKVKENMKRRKDAIQEFIQLVILVVP